MEAAKTALLEAQREHLAHWALPEETQETQRLAALQEAVHRKGGGCWRLGAGWALGFLMSED